MTIYLNSGERDQGRPCFPKQRAVIAHIDISDSRVRDEKKAFGLDRRKGTAKLYPLGARRKKALQAPVL